VFEVKLTPQAERAYVRLDPETMERIDRVFEQFEQGNLTHRNIRSLRDQYEGSFRYRLGKWRIIFRIDYAQRVVWVEAITTRKTYISS